MNRMTFLSRATVTATVLQAWMRRFSVTCLAGLAAVAWTAAPALADDPGTLLTRVAAFELSAPVIPADRPAAFSTVVTIDGQPRELVLERVSVWAPDAVVRIHRAGGVIEEVAAPTPNTYRGEISGVPGSAVSAAIKDDGLHAIIRVPGENLRSVAPLDGLGVHVVYRAKDYQRSPRVCRVPDDMDVEDPIAGGAAAASAGTGSSTHVAKFLVECDYEYFDWNGSVSATLDEMALVVNNVNEVYERDVNITHVLTLAVVRTTTSDPYTTAEGSPLLAEFGAVLATYDPGLFDLAMLFTNKDTWYADCPDENDNPPCPGEFQNTALAGLAQVGQVCNGTIARCFVEAFSNDTAQTIDAAHELGHVWSARHCGPAELLHDSCSSQPSPCNIMCGILGGCTGELGFGPCAVGAITAHRDSRTCLEPGTNGIQWLEWRSCGVFCPEDGDFEDPHNTLGEAAAESPSGGTIIIKAGSSTQAGGDETYPLTITKALTIRSFNGSATVGN